MYRVLEAGAIFQYSKEYRSENCPKFEKFQYELMANLPRIHCPKCSEYYGMYFKLFGGVPHCFSHSTVGPRRTRQITIRGLGLNTTHHDMRPIGLSNHHHHFKVDMKEAKGMSNFILGQIVSLFWHNLLFMKRRRPRPITYIIY